MRNRSIAPPLAVFVALAALAAPFPSRAAVTVEPPTGNADSALLADLHTWLKMIAEEQGADSGVDAALRIDAAASGEDVTLTLELVPSDGTASIRDTRVASRASAAAQARAMARAAIRKAAPPRTEVAVQASDAPKTAPPPQPVRPVLNSPYDQRRAYWISVGPTLGGFALGGAFVGLAFAGDDSAGRVGMIVTGASLAGLAFLVGPSLGHFYIRNNLQGSLTLVFRALLSGGAAALFIGGSISSAFSSDPCGFMGCSEEDYENGVDEQEPDDSGATGYFVGGALTSALAVALAIVDLATVHRAAQKANEKAAAAGQADAKISGVSFAPLVAPGPSGTATTGLAFSMRF